MKLLWGQSPLYSRESLALSYIVLSSAGFR